MNVQVQTNLAGFNAALERYVTLTRLTPEEAMLKQGAKLAFNLSGRLRALAPAKGATEAERRAAMERGEGIHVRRAAILFARRKTVATASSLGTRRDALFMERTAKGGVKRGGRSFWQIAIDRELRIREGGRGYLGFAARMSGGIQRLKRGAVVRQIDRIRREIGRAGLTADAQGEALRFEWDRDSIVEGLGRPKAEAAVASALADVRADMHQYLARKTQENARRSGLR